MDQEAYKLFRGASLLNIYLDFNQSISGGSTFQLPLWHHLSTSHEDTKDGFLHDNEKFR